ncbi:MAG: penicillin amidase, partial [Rhizobacter sp.]|nr:penicillin amidase [Rhizobacter sp.]
LMGDPHRELETPALYAQAHVKGASFDVIGLSVPGVPGFPHVAHNQHVAWCVTVACMDLHDFYIEHFRDEGREVRTSSGWEETRLRVETIHVRGAEPVVIEVFETAHGPVVSGDPRAGLAIALKSAQFLDSDRSIDCLLRMLRARDVQSLREATRGWGLIDHNLVAADTSGNIAHWVRARVPERPRENGWLPVPGWLSKHEWSGVVAFEDMPAAVNPPEHRIVTANNRVTADRATPYLSTDCYPPHRARRIAVRLVGLDTLSADAMEAIFADDLSLPGQLFIEKMATLPVEEPAARKLRDLVAAWDGHMDRQSAAASAYACVRLQLTSVVAEWSGLAKLADASASGATLGATAAVNHLWWIVPALLRDDDACLLAGRTWSDALLEALHRESLLTRSATPWGDLHRPLVKHPLTILAPTLAPTLDAPSATIGGDADTVMASGFTPAAGLATTVSSMARYVFDLGDWNACRWIAFQGASGVPGDAHRLDQNAAWAEVRTVPMLYDWAIITNGASS